MYNRSDDLEALVSAANLGIEYRDIIHKACDQINMPLGEDIQHLPNRIKALVRKYNNMQDEVDRLLRK